MKTATIQDLRKGQVLITKEGWTFTITKKYSEGIWETNKGKVIFEGEIHLYKAKY